MQNKNTNLSQVLKNFKISPTILTAVLGVVVVAGGSYGGYHVFKDNELLGTNQVAKYVKEIIDGDTFKLKSGETIRLSGINTPEPNECFGPEATEKLNQLILGKKLRLEKDIVAMDNLGRVLSHVVVINENDLEDNLWVNKYLIENGYARYYKSENVFMEESFAGLEAAARKNSLGLWSACKKEIEAEEKQAQEDSELNPNGTKKTGQYLSKDEQPTDPKCIIKGNISSDNKKVYLTPNCPNYSSTKIDISKGEQYFCTESDAKKNGFSKAFMCL